INAAADNVLYDNLTLKNVKGTLTIKDQKATIKNLSSELFGGTLGLTGEVSTKEDTPVFNMTLKVNAFDIASSFKELQLFQFLTPLASAVNGKLNSDISLSGNLKDDLTPNLSSLSGSVLGELLNASFSSEKSPLLQSFDQQLNFINLKDLDLKNLKTALDFNDGRVSVKPFNLKYQDIDIEVAGTHGLDKSLAYAAKLNVPAKYLGKDAGNLLAQLSEKEASETIVPVNVDLGGSFTSPSVKTDLKSAVANLTQQLAARQKDKLVDKGKDALTDLLDKDKNKDSTTAKKEGGAVKDAAKNVLGNLFKKKKDSTNQQ
ncbi:MAG: AsmA-like C-terminal region-containing protein, partial [Sinomicrobium sp.]|nr:AsmA-like C-terminal region-containing protein [Sinomicrobium sp.]